VNIDRYRALGPAAYMPHSYRPAVHCPGPAVPELKSDLAFVGTGFPSRVEFFEQMDLSGLDVLLAGGWPFLDPGSPLRAHLLDPAMAGGRDITEMACLDNEKTVEIYRSAKAGINFYRKEAEDEHAGEGWAMGPREVELAATGTFFLRDGRPEGDEVLHMLPRFDGPGDASEKLRWYLARDDLREKLAAQAREAVADRTFEANAKRLLRLLEA
jgi:spore maturation protein CgeB